MTLVYVLALSWSGQFVVEHLYRSEQECLVALRKAGQVGRCEESIGVPQRD